MIFWPASNIRHCPTCNPSPARESSTRAKALSPIQTDRFQQCSVLRRRIYRKRSAYTGHQQDNRRQYAGIRTRVLAERGNFVPKTGLFRHGLNGCLRVTAILAGHEYWEPDDPETQNSSVQDFQSVRGLVYHQTSAPYRRSRTWPTKNITIACSPTASSPHRVAPVTLVYPWHFDRPRRW